MIPFFFKVLFCLFERERDESFHWLIRSPDGCTGQDWATLKVEAGRLPDNLPKISSFHCFSRSISEELEQKRSSQAWNQSP